MLLNAYDGRRAYALRFRLSERATPFTDKIIRSLASLMPARLSDAFTYIDKQHILWYYRSGENFYHSTLKI
ncbi:MAG: hypothetical protein J5964_05130 [Eubacterium sp.]|nr:hypothetical protein [Eubacterium sp.]